MVCFRIYFNCGAALLFGLALAPHSIAEQVNLAVASNFMKPMAVLQAAFEQQSGHRLVVSYGSSGRLYAQIVNGAPFDLFLSADAAKPQALDAAGLTLTKPRVYATGRLVLWSRDARINIDGLVALQDPKVTKIAMANPRIAPYGLAARQVLENAKIYASVQSKLVLGENISQAYQFAYTRSAQVGFVALSQVIEEVPETDYWIVPPQLHEPIHQSAVVLNRAKDNSAAKQLFDFLLSGSAAKLIANFGYVPASSDEGDL
jgi:molybdate transport system substrate-binding protein